MRVLYQHTAALVQKLQAARRDLALEAAIHKLHKYHLVILDDFSCVTETSVLFELIGARYENRSLLVIANEPFSAWGKIFADAMTVAAVDRLVHRSHIFELNVESYRRRAAHAAMQAAAEKSGGESTGGRSKLGSSALRGHVWPSSAHQEAETVVLTGPQGGRSPVPRPSHPSESLDPGQNGPAGSQRPENPPIAHRGRRADSALPPPPGKSCRRLPDPSPAPSPRTYHRTLTRSVATSPAHPDCRATRLSAVSPRPRS